MHYCMIIIGKNENQCLNLLEQYSSDREVSYDVENDYWYNPDSRWDWYQIGGRYCARLEVRNNCEEYSLGEAAWCSQDNPYQTEKEGIRLVDGARIKDVLNIEELSCYGYVDASGWHDSWDEFEQRLFAQYEKNRKADSITAEEDARKILAEKEEEAARKFKQEIREMIKQDGDKYILVCDAHN